VLDDFEAVTLEKNISGHAGTLRVVAFVALVTAVGRTAGAVDAFDSVTFEKAAGQSAGAFDLFNFDVK
jgi:hypothetical protein